MNAISIGPFLVKIKKRLSENSPTFLSFFTSSPKRCPVLTGGSFFPNLLNVAFTTDYSMPKYKKYKIPIFDKICNVTMSIKTLLETGFFTDKLTAGKASFLSNESLTLFSLY